MRAVIKLTPVILATLLVLSGCHTKPESFNDWRIIFHTSMCYGACPEYHLQIDSSKHLKLYAAWVARRYKEYQLDSAKMGYFTGTVADTSFNKLVACLAAVNTDSLNFNGQICCDASLITLIIYHNGKRKYLQSMFPPQNAAPLIDILYEICERSELHRTTDTLFIEGKPADEYPPAR